MRRNNNRHAVPGKISPGSQRPPVQAWRVQVPTDAYLDHAVNPMSDRAFRVFLVLDGRAGMDPFCWPSNGWMTAKTGKKRSALDSIYDELERSGHIRRAYDGTSKANRVGFILLKRVAPDLYPSIPDEPGAIKQAEREMRSRIAGRSDSTRPGTGNPVSNPSRYREPGNVATGNPAPIDTGNPAPIDTGNPAPIDTGNPVTDRVLTLSSETRTEQGGRVGQASNDNDQVSAVAPTPAPRATPAAIDPRTLEIQRTLDRRRAEMERDRRRERRPAPMALDRAMADARLMASMAGEPINAGPGDMARFAPAGVRDFRAALDDDQRGRFDLLSPGKQAELLEPHATRFDPALLSAQVSEIEAARAPATVTVAAETTEELVVRVGQGDAGSVAPLAEALCQDFGGGSEDRRRWGAIHALAGQLHQGAVSADVVLDALRQSRNPACERPGAVFTKALKSHGWRPG